MKRKSNLRYFLIMEALLFATFGLILKNLDDSLGDKLLWAGAAALAFYTLSASFRILNKSSQKK